jgi:hypothetical protein
MVSTYGGSGNFLGKDVKTKERKTYSVNDTALPLPVMAKNVILAREKVEAGIRK